MSRYSAVDDTSSKTSLTAEFGKSKTKSWNYKYEHLKCLWKIEKTTWFTQRDSLAKVETRIPLGKVRKKCIKLPNLKTTPRKYNWKNRSSQDFLSVNNREFLNSCLSDLKWNKSVIIQSKITFCNSCFDVVPVTDKN